MKLTTKQEDLILEEGREKDNDVDIEMYEGYICPSCKVMGRGGMRQFEDEGSPCVIFECECGFEVEIS